MILIVGILLAVFSLAVVAYPLITGHCSRRRSLIDTDTSEHMVKLEAVYAAIETLMLEYQLGNIPQELYQVQLNDYRLQAAEFLRQRDQDESENPDSLLEQEILDARLAMGQMDDSPEDTPPRPETHC